MPDSAPAPTISTIPIIPATTPKSLRPVAACPARDEPRQDEREDRRRRIEDRREAGVHRLLCPSDQREGEHAVEARLEQEAAPERWALGEGDASVEHDGEQHQRGDRRAPGDERHRRDSLDADLDERERGAPERREQKQERELDGPRRHETDAG